MVTNSAFDGAGTEFTAKISLTVSVNPAKRILTAKFRTREKGRSKGLFTRREGYLSKRVNP